MGVDPEKNKEKKKAHSCIKENMYIKMCRVLLYFKCTIKAVNVLLVTPLQKSSNPHMIIISARMYPTFQILLIFNLPN